MVELVILHPLVPNVIFASIPDFLAGEKNKIYPETSQQEVALKNSKTFLVHYFSSQTPLTLSRTWQ